MKYTYQTHSESGSFAPPEGRDVEHANSKDELDSALNGWKYVHGTVGSDPEAACLIVWFGHLDDVTDIYPDRVANYGPRGGFHLHPC